MYLLKQTVIVQILQRISTRVSTTTTFEAILPRSETRCNRTEVRYVAKFTLLTRNCICRSTTEPTCKTVINLGGRNHVELNKGRGCLNGKQINPSTLLRCKWRCDARVISGPTRARLPPRHVEISFAKLITDSRRCARNAPMHVNLQWPPKFSHVIKKSSGGTRPTAYKHN